MDLTKHVTSSGLSRKLRKLGVPQLSFVFWSKTKYLKNGAPYPDNFGWKLSVQVDNDRSTLLTTEVVDADSDACSAFLASELGAMLPDSIFKKSGEQHHLHSFRDSEDLWTMTYDCTGYTHEEVGFISAATEVDARAKLLIRLIEQGIVNPKQ